MFAELLFIACGSVRVCALRIFRGAFLSEVTDAEIQG